MIDLSLDFVRDQDKIYYTLGKEPSNPLKRKRIDTLEENKEREREKETGNENETSTTERDIKISPMISIEKSKNTQQLLSEALDFKSPSLAPARSKDKEKVMQTGNGQTINGSTMRINNNKSNGIEHESRNNPILKHTALMSPNSFFSQKGK
jgi:hypothetical protein